MKRLITMLAVLVSSCAAHAEPAPMDGFEMLKAQQTLAWEIACEAMRADCTAFKQPDVGYMMMEPNSFGYYYYGSPMVAITLKLIGSPASVVVMTHEMIHFLQDAQLSEADVLFGGHRLWCAREQQAFELTYKMKQKYHLADFYDANEPNGLLAPKWEDRVVGYACLD